MNECSRHFFFFFSKDVSMKNGILRERGEGGEKNFILKSEFMFPEESNPFSIVSLFLPRSKLITKGSIKIQIIRKYFWIDILFSISQFKPVTLINHYRISPLTILTLPTEEKFSNNKPVLFERATTKKKTSVQQTKFSGRIKTSPVKNTVKTTAQWNKTESIHPSVEILRKWKKILAERKKKKTKNPDR